MFICGTVELTLTFRCFIPECEVAQNTSYDVSWIKWAIPQQSGTDQVIGFKADTCDKYAINLTSYTNLNETCAAGIFDTGKIVKCSEWVFDNIERTIVNDWNITCTENQWKLSLVGTSHFAGIVIGSGLFGILADKYGRKSIFVICIFIMTVFGVSQGFAPEYYSFVVLIFVNALGTAGVYPLAFILDDIPIYYNPMEDELDETHDKAMSLKKEPKTLSEKLNLNEGLDKGVEMVGKKKREITGIVLNYFYAVGEALVALIAWMTKDWIYLQVIVSAPSIVFVLYYWMVPESVRWLLANDKNQKAKRIVLKVAKINKVTLSSVLMDSFKENMPLKHGENEEPDEDKMWPVLKDMFRSRKLIIRFLIIYYIWAVNAFVYYGLSINATSLSGNKYINFALVSLIEIPGYSLAWVCIQKIGRRISLVLSLLLCGVTCTLTILATKVTSSWLVIVLFLLGKLGITSSFGVVYVYTAEMLPTVIRSGGVGMASTIARLGALLAPFVPLLGVYFSALPMLLFGGLAIFGGLLAMILPETFGTKLPETVAEAERL